MSIDKYSPKTVVCCSLTISAFIAFSDFLYYLEKLISMIILFVGTCIYLYWKYWELLSPKTRKFTQRLFYSLTTFLFIITIIFTVFRPELKVRRFILSELTLYYATSEPGWPGEDGTVFINYFGLTGCGIIKTFYDTRHVQMEVIDKKGLYIVTGNGKYFHRINRKRGVVKIGRVENE